MNDTASTDGDRRSNRRQTGAIHAITFFNSLATGVLWNGLGFLVEREYGYSKTQTLVLYIATAAVYTAAACWTGRVLRRMRGRVSPRSFLALVLAVQALAAPLVLLPGGGVWLVIEALVLSATGAFLWPVVESYLTSGKSGDSMRRAIGVWSLNWMLAVGVCMLLMAPLYAEGWTRWSMVAIAPLSIASIACLRLLPQAPAPHGVDHHDAPPTYRPMLAAARVLLPMSYVVVGALSPLLPYAMESLAVEPAWRTPLASLWLFVRVLAVLVLAFTHFWHGRWIGLVVAASTLAAGFALFALSPNRAALVIGLAAVGVGHGLLYYSALYYAMRVELADVDAGGTHEALVGVGYVVGPGAALAGSAWDGQRGIVIVELVVMGVAATGAVRAWRSARRASAGRARGA